MFKLENPSKLTRFKLFEKRLRNIRYKKPISGTRLVTSDYISPPPSDKKLLPLDRKMMQNFRTA
jgi:hypothetical protein